MTFRHRLPIALCALLAPALAAAPAAASIPCSKAAIARIAKLDRFESITTIRCADLTGDERRDVAWSTSGGGSGGDVQWGQWGFVYERAGQRRSRASAAIRTTARCGSAVAGS